MSLSSLLLRVYRPAPAAPQHADPAETRRLYALWRARMFCGFFLGYAVLYFCRKNISTAIPAMADDLHYSNTALGLIGSSLYVTYGIGKFVNGVLADRAHIRAFLCTALIISGAFNLLFGSVTALWALAFAWGANGWFQSMGFPPIARGMTLWFPPEGKATRWAMWTCSHQAGTAAIMGLTAWILGWGGWELCFIIPGFLCIGLGVVLWFTMGDTPSSHGLPPVEAFPQSPAAAESDGDYRATFVRCVLKNRNVWVIGFADLFAYVVRFGALDWAPKFLKEERGMTPGGAAFKTAIMPLFGVAGVLLAGYVADRVFRGRYRVVNVLSFGVLALALWGFQAVGPGSPWLDLALMAAVGFFVEVPQSILGAVAAVDAGGSARVAAAAAGLVGILAYVGATASGVGTGAFVDAVGWDGAFIFWIGCAVAGLLLCLFAWRAARATAAA
jgi:OPA family sugar phosphate sensor protein UhpC-like MFS transporter